jgi:hypothetical protein
LPPRASFDFIGNIDLHRYFLGGNWLLRGEYRFMQVSLRGSGRLRLRLAKAETS